MNSQHFHFQHHIDIPYLLLDMFLSHYIWVYQDTWLYHNHHQWIHYYTHNTRYCQCKCHCHYMLLHHHIQLKRRKLPIKNWGNLSLKNLQQFPGLASSSRQQLPALSGSSILVPVQRHSPGLFESSKQQPTTKVKKGTVITLSGEQQRKYSKYQRPVITVYIFTVWQWCFFF